MTEKLYYQNAYLTEFEADVLEIVSYRGKPAVVLDRSAFFPEGGGQPGDEGSVERCEVIDTQIENDVIFHILREKPLFSAGTSVHCSVNRELRFARMQAHSGEHIVSGIAHRLYGVNNVGFHMDGTVMTVDFDRPLSKEALERVEKQANVCVYKNVPIRCWYPDARELQTLEYRSKSDLLTDARIVTVEGYDDCACCAVHVSSTGQVGLIKILTSASHRGGVRITLICGVTAYEDYCCKHRQTLHIADVLAAKHTQTDEAVDKLIKKEKDLTFQLRRKTEAFIQYVKDHTKDSDTNLVFTFPAFGPEELKTAAVMLRDKCGGLCVVLSGDDTCGYSFAASSASMNVCAYAKIITAALNGSGGGRYEVIQGRLRSSLAEITQFFDAFRVNEL